MDAEPRWLRVREHFHRALDVAPDARGAWLVAECGEDPSLLAEVSALLAAHDAAGDFLEAEVFAGAGEPSWRTAAAGTRIGPFRVTAELGRGGMGAVYRAVRDDASFEQEVAIKLIKRGMDTQEILRRFLVERQILASLVHPNIARLLDGGTTEDGRPYFVMESIQGRSITEHCAARALGLEERLRLFSLVANAVQFAHQHLVVHRDLKPANVLVGDDGVPKLLDFGIAKLLAPAESEVAFTVEGSRPRTPDYASPEQLEGGPITTATDVYGLGLLLYELLTGNRPHPPDPGGAMVPPSVVVRAGDRRLARRLEGDLDTVVAKALEREPGQRYASAKDLADDVGRWLTHEPVAARRPTFRRRCAAFVRRHKLASAVGGVVAGLAVVAAVQAVALARERTHVEGQRRRAEALSVFLIDLFKVADPGRNRGTTVTVRELLDAGSRQLLEGRHGGPRWSQGVGSDLATAADQAVLLDAVGEVYQNLGLYPEASAALERSLALRAESAGAEAKLERARAQLLLAGVRREQGRLDEAAALLDEALATRRRWLGATALPVAEGLAELGLLAQQRNDPATGEHHLERAIAIQRQAGPAGELDLAESLSILATLEIDRERQEAAEASIAEARRLHRRLLGDDHPRTATDLTNLAGLVFQKGDVEAAARLLAEALELRRKLLGPTHPEVAEALISLSSVANAQGDLPAAATHARQALAIFETQGLTAHPSLPAALNNLAAVLAKQGELAAAEAIYERALEVFRERDGEASSNVATCLNNLAQVRRDRGDLPGARGLFERALAMWHATLGPEHPKVATARNGLAAVLQREGRLADAEAEFRRALLLRRKVLPPEHPDLANSLVGLGRVLVERLRAGEAEPLLVEALALRRRSLPPGHLLIGQAEGALGTCLLALGRRAEARELLQSSESILREALGPEHRDSRLAREHLAALEHGAAPDPAPP